MSGICVVHLVWAPLGIDPFKKFLASYVGNCGGIDHDLLVVFNGFSKKHQPGEYRLLLDGIKHESLTLPRRTLDISAYFTAAQNCGHQYFCFLNSYSVVLDTDWLAKMYAHAARADVGLVGATGSHQSLYSSLQRSMQNPRKSYFLRRVAGEYLRRYSLTRFHTNFDPFPNPHIRTNAFMIQRDIMLRLERGRLRTKLDTNKFESGKNNMTRQVLAMNLKALVVGRDGNAYEKEQWYESRTFRSGNQSNLLIADNRTSQYINSDLDTQRLWSEGAWGRR